MSGNSGVPVDPVDPAKKTSEIAGPTADEATVSMDLVHAKCYWNDVEYSQGERVNAADQCYECSYGRWVEIDD
jgi:hypothetical protein